MGGSKQPKNTTSTTTVELPSWAQNYAQQGLNSAWTESQKPYQAYPGQQIAPLTSQQTQGLQMTEDLAKNNTLGQAATTQATNTLNGMYLDPSTNPAWASGSKALADAYSSGTAATRNAAFSKVGAFGADNSAFNQYAGQQDEAFGNSLGQLWGDLYNTERANQMKAAYMSPGLSQANYGDAQNLIGAGDAYRTYNQDLLNQDYQNWYDQQNYPWSQNERFASLFPAYLGNQGTTSSRGPNPAKGSALAGMVGGGLLGAGAYGALGSGALALSNPWAAAAIGGGALLGSQLI
jgi:hypothetical protein